jgi:hypothetical protein
MRTMLRAAGVLAALALLITGADGGQPRRQPEGQGDPALQRQGFHWLDLPFGGPERAVARHVEH